MLFFKSIGQQSPPPRYFPLFVSSQHRNDLDTGVVREEDAVRSCEKLETPASGRMVVWVDGGVGCGWVEVWVDGGVGVCRVGVESEVKSPDTRWRRRYRPIHSSLWNMASCLQTFLSSL